MIAEAKLISRSLKAGGVARKMSCVFSESTGKASDGSPHSSRISGLRVNSDVKLSLFNNSCIRLLNQKGQEWGILPVGPTALLADSGWL